MFYSSNNFSQVRLTKFRIVEAFQVNSDLIDYCRDSDSTLVFFQEVKNNEIWKQFKVHTKPFIVVRKTPFQSNTFLLFPQLNDFNSRQVYDKLFIQRSRMKV